MANRSIRYGARIRKQYDAVQREKNALYKCPQCGRIKVKRISTGIWRCAHCDSTYAGGAYSMNTAPGDAAKRLIEEIGK